jgi:hypothetical protein
MRDWFLDGSVQAGHKKRSQDALTTAGACMIHHFMNMLWCYCWHWVEHHLYNRPIRETRANFCRSQSLCKSFRICKVFSQICICHKCYVNLKFAGGLNLLFTCTAHASLPQILSLWSICSDHKFDRILYICERTWEANQRLCGLQKLALVSRAISILESTIHCCGELLDWLSKVLYTEKDMALEACRAIQVLSREKELTIFEL